MAALTSESRPLKKRCFGIGRSRFLLLYFLLQKMFAPLISPQVFVYLYLYLKPLETVGCVVKKSLFCGQTLRNCPSRNSTLFSSRWSTLLNQLRQRSFWTNFPHITGLFLQLKMVGLINLALFFRYNREFPHVSSLFQYIRTAHSFKECDAMRRRVTCSPSQHCVKARVYARSGVKHTSYDKGYANTCSPSASDVCRDPNYKCEVSQLLLISLLQWSLRSSGGWDSSNCHRNCQLHVLDMFGYSVG